MKTTKSWMKAVMTAGLLVLGLGVVNKVHAANPDTMVITVTPGGVTYAVTITSPQVGGYAFGVVNIGLTTISTEAISVQNSGNISAYFSLAVADTTGGGNAWANDLSAATTTYAMYALFNATQPAEASFNGATNNVPAAVPGAAATRHGQASTKTGPGLSQNLWLRLGMPTGVAENGEHTLVLSVNGQAS